MTVGAGITAGEGKLMVKGETVLTDVIDNNVLTPPSTAGAAALANCAFLGVVSNQMGSHSVFPVGKLQCLRFMCLFRFKMWWMTQRMGTCGKDIPFETHFLIVEANDVSPFDDQSALYTVFFPILEGDFRAVLRGNERDELEICLESGDPAVDEFVGLCRSWVRPFLMLVEMQTVGQHLQTFCHRARKKMADMLNWFGWCTWDAFYTDVTSDEKQGTPPKFVIIDDGWQSLEMDSDGIKYKADNCANFANRLTNIKENHKFQKDGKEGHRVEDPALGLRHIVSDIREKHALKYIYVWHAITGYWGGVRPGVTEMEHYESIMAYPIVGTKILKRSRNNGSLTNKIL